METRLLPETTSASLINAVHCADLFDLCERVYRAGVRVDLVLADLPYNTTQNEWDALIPFALMWAAFKRITAPGAAIVLTASQPFTSALVCSNLKMFRYEWIWRKSQATGFLDANRKPLKEHESVLVFCDSRAPYYPQLIPGTPYKARTTGARSSYGKFDETWTINDTGKRYPKTIIDFDVEVGLHPTQKPQQLFEYLIRTYTLEGQIVFDPTCGSGTTARAAIATNRRFIVGDSAAEYVAISRESIRKPFEPREYTPPDKPLPKPVIQIGDMRLEQQTMFDDAAAS